jgi:hypothetical protein
LLMVRQTRSVRWLVILHCNFEELRALASGVELLLTEHQHESQGYVVAPSEALTDVQRLQPRLTSSLSIHTLAEQRSVRKAVAAICDDLHDRLEEKVIQFHPAHEEAVSLYFDYAHVFAVLKRLDQIGAEMTAMIELMTGAPVTDNSAKTIPFPD